MRTDDGRPLTGLRIVAPLEQALIDARLPVLGNCAAREPDGSWTFVARDLGAWKVLVLCDGYEQAALTVPARSGSAEPLLELALTRKKQ